LVYSVAIQLAHHHGLGRHYEYLTIQTSFLLLKWAYVAFAFCIVGPVAGRVSFTLYLLSIIGNARHGMRYWLWSLVALQAIINIALLAATYSVCGTDLATIGMYGIERTRQVAIGLMSPKQPKHDLFSALPTVSVFAVSRW